MIFREMINFCLKIKIVMLIAVLFFSVYPKYAVANDDTRTVYYVNATSGSDSNNGKSLETPWRTINKVNSTKFSPGDTVLFKCGNNWEENLVIPSSGTSTKPIFFGSYGIGDYPQLYRVSLWAGKKYVRISKLNMKMREGAALSIESGEDIVIDDCIIDGDHKSYNHAAVIYGLTKYGWANAIVIKNSKFKDAGTVENPVCNLSINGLSHNILIANNISYNASDNNMQAYSNKAETGPYNVIFRGNELYNSRKAHGLEIGWNVHNSVVEKNRCYGNKICGLIVVNSHDNVIKNNIVYDNVEEMACYGESYNNLWLNNTILFGDRTVKGMWFRAKHGAGNVFMNNIVVGNNSNFPELIINGAEEVESDYNCFYDEKGTKFEYKNLIYTSLDSYQSMSNQDIHSIEKDPRLIDEKYDLKSNSPCINAGITHLGVLDDFRGIERPQGVKYDIGAYEHVLKFE